MQTQSSVWLLAHSTYSSNRNTLSERVREITSHLEIIHRYCHVLDCNVLYCTGLLCTIAYCGTIMCWIGLYWTVVWCDVVFSIELCRFVMYCAALLCVVLHWTVLFCTPYSPLSTQYSSRQDTLYLSETFSLMLDRWEKLRKDFYSFKTSRFVYYTQKYLLLVCVCLCFCLSLCLFCLPLSFDCVWMSHYRVWYWHALMPMKI